MPLRRLLAEPDGRVAPEGLPQGLGLLPRTGQRPSDPALASARLGADHPGVGLTLLSIGIALRQLDRVAEASPVLEWALAVVEASLGPDHPTRAAVLHTPGETRRPQRRLPEAVTVFERAIRISGRSIGAEHPSTAYDTATMASLSKPVRMPSWYQLSPALT